MSTDALLLADPDVLPDLSLIQTEDGAPLDNIFAERQASMLVESLRSSWPGPGGDRPFFVTSNVGLFYAGKVPPVVPDVMLSLDVRVDESLEVKEHRSYFTWLIGKMPEVVIEIVSPTLGGEDTDKLELYSRLRIDYYVIFDPGHFLSDDELRVFAYSNGRLRPVEPGFLEKAGLGVTIWEGEFDGELKRWLRWTDATGSIVPLGVERAIAAEQLAEGESLRAKAAVQRADRERARADQAERDRTELAERVARLEAKLREAGLSG